MEENTYAIEFSFECGLKYGVEVIARNRTNAVSRAMATIGGSLQVKTIEVSQKTSNL